MNLKKIVAAGLVGAMVLGTVPVLTGTLSAPTAYAAKGGAKLGGGFSAPKAAPKAAAPSANSGSKSVSGNGGSYQPSKDAKSLDKNAPAANASAAKSGAASSAQSGSRWGSALRNIGLLAGGMMLGSMLASMFGMGGMLGDIMGVLANVVLLFVAIMAIKWIWNKVRGGRREENVYQSAARRGEPINITPQKSAPRMDIQDIAGPASGTDYNAKSMADRYRNK